MIETVMFMLVCLMFIIAFSFKAVIDRLKTIKQKVDSIESRLPGSVEKAG